MLKSTISSTENNSEIRLRSGFHFAHGVSLAPLFRGICATYPKEIILHTEGEEIENRE